jgi:hypothetical protein
VRRILLAMTVALLLTSNSLVVQADPPAYLVLQTPPAPLPHQPTYNLYPGTGLGVSTHSYSYGWFGAAPRKHWSRHFGYYRNYTQWSAK